MKIAFLIGVALLVTSAFFKEALQSTLLMIGFLIIVAVAIYIIVSMFTGRDITAKREIFIPLDPGRIPRKQIKETLEALGCSITRDQKTDIEGSIGLNWRSWGEDVSVKFVDNGMMVRSTCASSYLLQIFDWGKNSKNLQRFVAEWEKRIAQPGNTADRLRSG